MSENGIRCPWCHCAMSSVTRTITAVDKKIRRRQCRNCGREFTTSERAHKPLAASGDTKSADLRESAHD